MCSCVSKVDKVLAKYNTALTKTSLINMKTGRVRESILIATHRRDGRERRSKVKLMLPSFCPFCGKGIRRARA